MVGKPGTIQKHDAVVYKSLIADFGYDISDYEAIQPEYGTMDDFNELIAKAKELGRKYMFWDEENMTQKTCCRCTKFMFGLCTCLRMGLCDNNIKCMYEKADMS